MGPQAAVARAGTQEDALSTEMLWKPMPRMPSNRPIAYAAPRPVVFVTSAKVAAATETPPTETVSALRKPLTGPEP